MLQLINLLNAKVLKDNLTYRVTASKFTICVSLLMIFVVIPVVTGLEVTEPNSLEFAISLEYIQLLIG